MDVTELRTWEANLPKPPWEVIRNANLDGMFNLYEAARKSPITPRIIFARIQITPLDFTEQTAPIGCKINHTARWSLWRVKGFLVRRLHRCIMINSGLKPPAFGLDPVFQNRKTIGCCQLDEAR